MQSIQSPQKTISIQRLNQVIKNITEPFIGQSFRWLSIGYGDEVYLHFGNENITESKQGRIYKEGDWVLETYASLWELENNQEIIIDHTVFDEASEEENETKLHKKFEILINKPVHSICIKNTKRGLKTVLQFTDGLSLDLSPHPNDPDLPLWELFMPTDQVLTLENKAPFWSCGSIHGPA